MKSLRNYIYENQEKSIDEGLIGDIIMKVLSTGLDWIGNSVAWVANNVKEAVGEMWKSAKDVADETWDKLGKAAGIKNLKAPKSDKDLNAILKEAYMKYPTFEERVKKAEEILPILKDDMEAKDYEVLYVNAIYTLCVMVTSNEKCSDEEKEAAKKKLEEVEKQYPRAYKQVAAQQEKINKKKNPKDNPNAEENKDDKK